MTDHSSSRDRVIQELGKLTHKVNIDVKMAVDARADIDVEVISTPRQSRRHFHYTSIQVSRKSYGVFPPKRDLHPKAL